jgi:hypothetical protein
MCLWVKVVLPANSGEEIWKASHGTEKPRGAEQARTRVGHGWGNLRAIVPTVIARTITRNVVQAAT